MVKFWPLIEEYLIKSLNVVESYPPTFQELLGLQADDELPLLTPDIELTRIKMDGEVEPEQYIENAVRYLIFEQKLGLQISTWRLIKELFDLVKTNPTDARLKSLQIFLNISKMDAVELFTRCYPTWAGMFPNASIGEFFDKFFLRKRETLQSLIGIASAESIVELGAGKTKKIKKFLVLPSIVKAFKAMMTEAKAPAACINEKWIVDAIGKMKIYVCSGIIGLNGVVMRDGFLIVDNKSKLKNFLSRDTKLPKEKVWIFSLSTHESGQFLLRAAEDDYNYSSPGKGDEERKYDPEIASKFRESGRLMETLLCNGIQINWDGSKPEAALEYLSNARTRNNYPIINDTTPTTVG